MAVNVVLKSVFDDKGIKQAQDEFAKVGKTVGIAFAAVGATLTAAGVAAIRFGVDAAKGAEQAAIAQRRLDQIAESMGLFGDQTAAVSKRLGEFAEANELIVGVDADVIKATQAKLLTFKNLAVTANEVGGAMDRATMAAVDLAAAGFGSAETNAIQLGKALQDPIKGITALARAGVTFTAQEKENIKILVESGKVLDAQNLILQSIETQVGGTAKATASAFTRIELATNQVKDAIGEALLPVIEDFADDLAELVPQLQKALGPAAQQVATIIAKELTPAIERFGDWLRSPEGTKAVADFTRAVADGVKKLFDFAKGVFENIDQIKTFAVLIGGATIALKTMETAIQLARGAQLLLNVAVKANPYVLAATALIALAGGMTAVMVATKDSTSEFDVNRMSTEKLNEELAKLKAAYEDGLIPTNKFIQKQAQLEAQLRRLQGQAAETAGELNRFNNIGEPVKLDKANDAWSRSWQLRGEAAKKAAEESESAGNTITDASAAAAAALKKIEDAAEKSRKSAAKNAKEWEEIFANFNKKQREEAAKAAADLAEAEAKRFSDFVEARKKTLDFLADLNSSIAKANSDYDKAVREANADYFASVAEIRKDYGDKLEQIILDSQARLTDAFRSAVSADVGKLFSDSLKLQSNQSQELAEAQAKLAEATVKLKREQEDLNLILAKQKPTQEQLVAARRAYEDAKAEVDDITKKVDELSNKANPLDQLVASLQTRLLDARALIANTAALAALGFTQTFIEQVVSSGAETGNQLAQAILQSTPETQEELKNLYKALEETSENGLDSVAKSIYEKQGLATQELKDLYKQTNSELNQALIEQQRELDASLTKAAENYKTTLDGLIVNITDFVLSAGGEFGGLLDVINLTTQAINGLMTASAGAQVAANEKINVFNSSLENLKRLQAEMSSKAAEINATIVSTAPAVNDNANLISTVQGATANNLLENVSNTTQININVKTDPTKNLAQTGKVIAETVQKYTQVGGNATSSASPWLVA